MLCIIINRWLWNRQQTASGLFVFVSNMFSYETIFDLKFIEITKGFISFEFWLLFKKKHIFMGKGVQFYTTRSNIK